MTIMVVGKNFYYPLAIIHPWETDHPPLGNRLPFGNPLQAQADTAKVYTLTCKKRCELKVHVNTLIHKFEESLDTHKSA